MLVILRHPGQNYYYFNYGYREALMRPAEYINKLTDYSEDGKQLNYIVSYYHPVCNVNIITKVGFGVGVLKRVNHTQNMRDEQPGAPYQLKVGFQWTSHIPYENPGDFLTFQWFKTNIMCADHPWICARQRISPDRYRRWWNQIFGNRIMYKS